MVRLISALTYVKSGLEGFFQSPVMSSCADGVVSGFSKCRYSLTRSSQLISFRRPPLSTVLLYASYRVGLTILGGIDRKGLWLLIPLIVEFDVKQRAFSIGLFGEYDGSFVLQEHSVLLTPPEPITDGLSMSSTLLY